MDGNGLSGGRMYPNMNMNINMAFPHPHPHSQQPQPQPQQQQIDHPQSTQLSMRQPNYPPFNPNPNPHFINSDEDEPNFPIDQDNTSSSDLKRKAANTTTTNYNNNNNNNNNNSNGGASVSPWQRMKWTDNMVRLLIMAVYYIGDEVVVVAPPESGSDKKKPGCPGVGAGVGGVGAMQKKGKWKSVSKAMMEKGFYVSPQQCEDKFNDLNKRYKRVNDILGKGTACKVVENQSLLESMDLSPKMKEEVRKLLNSKHLFFREMCAYHNSCGHAAAAAAAAAQPAAQLPPQSHGGQGQGQGQATALSPSSCLHSTQLHPSMVQNNNLGNEEEHEHEEEDEDDEEEEDEEEVEDHEDGRGCRKRARTSAQGGLGDWGGQVMGMLQDGSKSAWEKKQWVMNQMMELEENGIKFQREALELEKERFKWIKFCSKKEREMEKVKLDNERKRLQNESMLLLLRKKEIEYMILEQRRQQQQQQQQQQKPAVNPSCISV